MTSERFDRGMKIRREVLGDEFVDASLAKLDDFGKPMHDLTTEYCWGEIWGRDDLPRPMRSLLNIGILAALNRPNEIKTHVRGALRNGCTKEEIRGVILQVAIYCGVPAAVDSFRSVREALAQQQG